MTYGGSALGSSAYGSIPDPSEFEEQSEELKNENYRQLYEKMQNLEDEVAKSRDEAKKFRTRTWIWRVGSFLVGNASGFIVGALI